MKSVPKLPALLLAILFVASGLFVKQKVSFETGSLPGLVAGQQTSILSRDHPEIPLYRGATVASLWENSESFVATLESPDDPQKITNFYENILAANGWQKDLGNFVKGSQSLALTAAQNADKTQTVVLISYSLVPTK